MNAVRGMMRERAIKRKRWIKGEEIQRKRGGIEIAMEGGIERE